MLTSRSLYVIRALINNSGARLMPCSARVLGFAAPQRKFTRRRIDVPESAHSRPTQKKNTTPPAVSLAMKLERLTDSLK